MPVHSFHDQIVHQQLEFHSTTMHNKTLNRAIHDQHYWQNENIDKLKYDFCEYISAEMSRLINTSNNMMTQINRSSRIHVIYAHRLKTAR